MAHTSGPASAKREIIRDVALSLLLGGVAPLVIYALLRPHTSELRALIISAAAPVLDNGISLARRRTLDVFGAFVLAGILLSVVLVLFGGSTRLILVRESLLTGATGAVFLLSLLYKRPLIYYFAMHFNTGGDKAKAAEFSGMWQYPYFRHVMRWMTAVWGLALVLEATIRTYLAFSLSTITFLAISPVVQYGIIGATVLWTVVYSKHSRRIGAQMRAETQRGAADAGN